MQDAENSGGAGERRSDQPASIPGGEGRGTLKPVPMGHILLREGEPGDCMYVIRGGLFEVTHNGQFLALVGAGEVLGEMALIDEEPRAATVVAIAPSEVLEVTRADFNAMIADPGFVKYLLKMLTGRLRNTDGLASAFLSAAVGGAPAPVPPETKPTQAIAGTSPRHGEVSWSGPSPKPSAAVVKPAPAAHAHVSEKKWGE